MIDAREVEREIHDLEQKETSYGNCERLAWLYIVRDNLHKSEAKESPAPSAVKKDLSVDKVHVGDRSEFLRAINGKRIEEIIPIMDELMTDTLKIIHPRLYEGVINKISQL